MHATKEQLKELDRLKKRSDFVLMNAKGRKWVARGLILQARPNDLKRIRVGFTVTKKTEKSAARRNRIKRRLRAAAADILPHRAAGSHDYVLIGRAGGAARSYKELLEDLTWCLRKLGTVKTDD